VTENLSDGFDPRGCFVYLLWEDAADRVPIYVGQSTNILVRLASHMIDPAKKYRVRHITLIRCRDGRRMDDTERRLIQRYRPELNTAGIPRGD
jgi:excinuclease UvrABC nuclease subunit